MAKAVKSKRARVVIVAPNIEHIQTEGGLDDLLTSILSQADELSIPVVFALSRKKLGQVSSSSSPQPKKFFQTPAAVFAFNLVSILCNCS